MATQQTTMTSLPHNNNNEGSSKEKLIPRHRTPPRHFQPLDLGSPVKVWTMLYHLDDIYSLRRRMELFQRHPKLDGDMRTLVIEWLMQVCAEKRLHRETFHLCVDYFDRFLVKTRGLDSSKLQLIAATSLLIAAKVEEITSPKPHDIADLTAGCCSSEDLLHMEPVLLQTLDWDLCPVTGVQWLALYLQLIGQTNGYSRSRHFQQRLNEFEMVTIGTLSFHYNHDHYQKEINESASRNGVHQQHQHFCSDTRLTMTVPKLMRDEFIRLVVQLDLALLDSRSLCYKYSELAAALLLHHYEPEEFILQITDFSVDALSPAYAFLKPFIDICEKRVDPAGSIIPHFQDAWNILPVDQHNIQTFDANTLHYFDEAQAIVKNGETKSTSYNNKKGIGEDDGPYCNEVHAEGKKENHVNSDDVVGNSVQIAKRRDVE